MPLFVVVLALSAPAARAQTTEDADRTITFELGWAGDWSRGEGLRAGGGTVAFEVTPIEHWLEIEVGVSAIREDTGTELPVDVLFKKPWPLSRGAELMIGAGRN